MSAVIEANGLGKRYRRRWALSECTLSIPEGKVVGLVGPNGAGKTTLLHLAVGLLSPSAGSIAVLGDRPAEGPEQLGRVGFVAQDTPTYAAMSVADHLNLGRWLNPQWDNDIANRRIAQLGLDPCQRAGSLSGGQRAQLALTLAIAKRPQLLILDEPVASLDPLARREFLQGISDVVDEHELSVVFSSHLVTDVERVCDYVIVLVASRIQIAGEIAHVLSSHRLFTGPSTDARDFAAHHQVIEESHDEQKTSFLVHSVEPIQGGGWVEQPVSLEDVVLAYMGRTQTVGGPHAKLQTQS